MSASVLKATNYSPKLWIPRQVIVTPAARQFDLTEKIVERAARLGANIIEAKNDRLVGLRGADERETYKNAKTTLAIVVSPQSQRKLQPIPPSADWQFHIARGCPAHCQYCYLAGSLPGPPVTRVYANLDEILDGLKDFEGQGTVTSKSDARAQEGTTFEASCYTDPLALEHLTGALAQSITFFGAWDASVQLRWTTKFDNIDSLVGLQHNEKTRVRFSVNAEKITREFEGGTSSLKQRIDALAVLARAGYPVGLTVAPIMPIDNWAGAYERLFKMVRDALEGVANLDLSVELITHRFTPTSKEVLNGWYPASSLEMDETIRAQKRTKFGTSKYVYPKGTMLEMREFFYFTIGSLLPNAKILYWT